MYRWCWSWIQKYLPASVSHSEQMPLAGSAQWLAQTFGGEICNPLAVCGFGVIWIIWTCFWRKNMHAHICTLIWCKRTIENITTMPVIKIVLLIQIKIIYINLLWNYSVPGHKLCKCNATVSELWSRNCLAARVKTQLRQWCSMAEDDTSASWRFVALRTTVSHRSGKIWRTTLHYFHRCPSRETFTHFYSLHPIAWQSPVILVFAFQSPVVNPTKSAMSVPASAATTTSHCFSWWTCKAPILGETCRNIQGLSPLVEHNKANHKTKAKLRTPKISRDFSQTKMIENQCSWIRQCHTVTGTMPPNP